MRFQSLFVAALAGAALISSPPAARAQVGVDIHIGNAPPPPRVVFYHPPRWVVVPGTRVYEVDYDERPNYDMFMYSGFYWVYDDGYWYRASRYNGPFMAVDARYVPTQIYYVPRTEWRSYPANLPPGIAKKMRGRQSAGWGDDRGRGHGHGHGRGRGDD
jgi:hypothetical protein